MDRCLDRRGSPKIGVDLVTKFFAVWRVSFLSNGLA